MASAAGGTNQRLNPGFATIRSRSSKPAIRRLLVRRVRGENEVHYRGPEKNANPIFASWSAPMLIPVARLSAIITLLFQPGPGSLAAQQLPWLSVDSAARTVSLTL